MIGCCSRVTTACSSRSSFVTASFVVWSASVTDAILYVYAATRCLVGGGSCTSVVFVAAVASVAASVRCCLVCRVASSVRGLVGVGNNGLEWSAVDEVAIGLEELECCTKRAVVVPGLGVDSLISCCCASASVEVAWSAIDGLTSGSGSAKAGSCCVGCFGAHGVPCCWFSSCSSYLKSCCSLLIVLALMTPSVVPTNDSPLLSSTPSQIALCSAKSPLTSCFAGTL